MAWARLISSLTIDLLLMTRVEPESLAISRMICRASAASRAKWTWPRFLSTLALSCAR